MKNETQTRSETMNEATANRMYEYDFCRTGYSRSECSIAAGQILRNKRLGVLIVTRADEPIDTDDGQKPWAQYYWARVATAAEETAAERATRAAALTRELRGLSGPADDDRDHERRVARREAIQAEIDSLALVGMIETGQAAYEDFEAVGGEMLAASVAKTKQNIDDARKE